MLALSAKEGTALASMTVCSLLLFQFTLYTTPEGTNYGRSVNVFVGFARSECSLTSPVCAWGIAVRVVINSEDDTIDLDSIGSIGLAADRRLSDDGGNGI